MKEPTTEQRSETIGAEWFAAWLPKPVARSRSEVPETVENIDPFEPKPLSSSAIEEVRAELKAVTDNLIDPSAQGIRASIPHLERAVTAFGNYFKTRELPALDEPSLDALRAELALATKLFENAYSLQAGWAAQLGLNLDGTPKQLLYSRPGHAVVSAEARAAGTWEG